MRLPFFQVDAFADAPFKGNPAAVMVMEGDFGDDILQAIAAENNLSETAFIWKKTPGQYQLRWFTPTQEVPLCGHASLAATHVVLTHLGGTGNIAFETVKSGVLTCSKTPGGYQMDFPAHTSHKSETIDPLWTSALGETPIGVWIGNFTAIQLETPDMVRALSPDISALATLGETAREGAGNVGVFALNTDKEYDVISRFFAPGSGINEDPATGSWHCLLPNIIETLTGKTTLNCLQAFPTRGAKIGTDIQANGRIALTGQAHTLIEGVFTL